MKLKSGTKFQITKILTRMYTSQVMLGFLINTWKFSEKDFVNLNVYNMNAIVQFDIYFTVHLNWHILLSL